jgi:hypothetical protein
MIAFSMCPACGEFAHHDLCKPALATLLAEERLEHDEDKRKMVRLEIELADLRIQLQERNEHHR